MLRRILIILGALVALLPYLGLPRSWDNVLFTFAGLAIVVLLVLTKRSSAPPREVPHEEVAPSQHGSTETKRPVTTASAPLSNEHRRPSEPTHKTHEAQPKSEARRIGRVSPSHPVSPSPAHRPSVTNHPGSNDVVVPPAVRPSPPSLPTSDVSPVSTPTAFEERKPAPIRRQKPKSAEDFLKGDSA